jgi:ABC-type multidrug transport system ATPase subunit
VSAGTADVLFLDEPTTGLDPASRLTIWDEVRRINAGGATVFLTTQYLEEADKLCDRLAIIDDGQIVAEGTPEQLKAEMGHDVVSVALGGADVAATEAADRPPAGPGSQSCRSDIGVATVAGRRVPEGHGTPSGRVGTADLRASRR